MGKKGTGERNTFFLFWKKAHLTWLVDAGVGRRLLMVFSLSSDIKPMKRRCLPKGIRETHHLSQPHVLYRDTEWDTNGVYQDAK